IRVTIPAMGEMPYFVRSGSVIPYDEAAYGFMSEPETVFTVFPVEEGEFDAFFFSDDGKTFAYENNECVKLTFRVECTKEKVSVRYINKGKNDFKVRMKLVEGDGRDFEICGE
ncbi:MAG: DUF5110 domain-containing protein, partial [Clostridia bacterium]|nr:DUF5110 domain-containing protein [Clostridia bacterium]